MSRWIEKLAGFFAMLAILISLWGVGLASFTAKQRTKEAGIGKVLGVSIFSLWRLLSGDFVLLVSVSFLLAHGA